MATFEQILKDYKKYHPEPKITLLEKTYELAKIVYFGEKRISGRIWIEHALATAYIITDLKMDTASICAAILHDGYKFGLTPSEVEQELNFEIRHILDNLDTLKSIKGKYHGKYSDRAYSDYLRNLILAASNDVRAIVIRLAEKLNSLSTIEELDEEQREDSLKKAFEIYAPLADQVGVYEIRSKLENLAFKIKDPKLYEFHEHLINEHPYAKEEKMQEFILRMSDLLNSKQVLVYGITGRIKKAYSLFQKAEKKSLLFPVPREDYYNYIHDKVAFRILVDTIPDCYKVLDIIHSSYKYLSEEFDDYISKPKPNGYQSIQTSIEVEPGHYVEVQIKTKKMHEYNEWGPASHYFYKEGPSKKRNSKKKIEVLKQLLNWRDGLLKDKTQANIEDIDDSIFVFTPKGDIIELVKNATPVDFAYKIHTKLGDTIGKVLVNNKMKPLDYVLASGDVVEVFQNKNRKGPSRDWLGFVKSKEARLHIKKWVNRGG